MTGLTVASNEADARAAESVEAHHAEMVGALAVRARTLVALARTGQTDFVGARDDLAAWGRDELLPHALAEESTLYRAGSERPEGRLLVEAMLAEHRVLTDLVEEVAAAQDAVSAAIAARVLETVFSVHLAKENDQILPLLVGAADVSVADLLGGMHELLGDSARRDSKAHQAGDEDGHTCGCHDTEDAVPELDAREIPHAIRHATIFGALDAVRPGSALVLVAPHDPLPLLAQLEQRQPGAFEVSYLERGPEAWRLRLARCAA